MKQISSVLIFVVLIASGLCEDTTSTVNPITETTTLVSQTETTSTDTTLPSSQTDTTVPSTTSTVPPTTVPSTTTAATPTTTSVMTTTSITTTTSPTTVPPSTTTKSPEPPTPVEGSWNVSEGNETCIKADLKVRFKIAVKDHVEYIALSPNATSSGNCEVSNMTQELTLEESDYKLSIIFQKDSTHAYIQNITFSYTLPDVTGNVYNDSRLFSAKIGNSYMCDSTNDVILGNVTMEVFRIHIQSFGKSKDFGTAEECDADNKINDMVPIAVGIALLALVVVVLIAYFVGRRRSRQKGYQSV